MKVAISVSGDAVFVHERSALYVAGVCPSERQSFRVMLMHYLATEFPRIDAGTHLATANNAIELAQKYIVTTFIERKAARPP